MNLSMLHEISQSAEGWIHFCKEKGLLGKALICPHCPGNVSCKWQVNTRVSDGFAWRCSSCRRFMSIRSGTFFERSKLKLGQILTFLYLWSHENASYKNIRRECRITSRESYTDWKNFFRDICCQYFESNPRVIGGPGHTVEIEETLVSRRKYDVGRTAVPLWIFGGYDPADKLGFLVAVPDRKAETLLPIIKKYIFPGTTIVSGCWKAYDNLEEQGFAHLTVNHTQHFVDPETEATTNHVERMWKEAKRRNKKECGTSRNLIFSYLQEFMWRQQFGKQPFENMLQQISDLYPVEEKKQSSPAKSLPSTSLPSPSIS